MLARPPHIRRSRRRDREPAPPPGCQSDYRRGSSGEGGWYEGRRWRERRWWRRYTRERGHGGSAGGCGGGGGKRWRRWGESGWKAAGMAAANGSEAPPVVRLATRRGSGHSGGSSGWGGAPDPCGGNVGCGAGARALRRGNRVPGRDGGETGNADCWSWSISLWSGWEEVMHTKLCVGENRDVSCGGKSYM